MLSNSVRYRNQKSILLDTDALHVYCGDFMLGYTVGEL